MPWRQCNAKPQPTTQNKWHNDVARKKELWGADNEPQNFVRKTGRLPKAYSPPQEPSEQTRKAQGSASSKRNAQFSASCLVAHHAECTERIEMESARGPAVQLSQDVARKYLRPTQAKLSPRAARVSPRALGHLTQ